MYNANVYRLYKKYSHFEELGKIRHYLYIDFGFKFKCGLGIIILEMVALIANK